MRIVDLTVEQSRATGQAAAAPAAVRQVQTVAQGRVQHRFARLGLKLFAGGRELDPVAHGAGLRRAGFGTRPG
jgi:hypothetical protein